MADNYYKILGVRLNADINAIKRAFRARAKQYHPDNNPGDKNAEQKFKELNDAYEVLGDKKKRAIYDEVLRNIKKAAAKPGRFASFFSHRPAPYSKEPALPANTLAYGVVICILLYGLFGNQNMHAPQQNTAGGHMPFSLNALQPAAKNGKNQHTSHNQDIGRATGLLITRIDGQGNQLPITGGYIPDAKFVVRLNNKPIITDGSDASLNFTFHHKVNNEHVVVLEGNGGAACPSRQTLIVIKDGSAVFIQGFGNCDEPEISTLSKDEIQFSFFSTYGERLVVSYKNHQLTQSTLMLAPHFDEASREDGYRYLMRYFDNLENIVNDAKLLPELSRMLGQDLPLLKTRLEMYTRPHVEDGCIIVTGLKPGNSGSNEGFLAIALDGSGIYSAILKSDHTQETDETSRSVSIYSNRPSMYSNIPDALNRWLEKWKNTYPDIPAEWHFAPDAEPQTPPQT